MIINHHPLSHGHRGIPFVSPTLVARRIAFVRQFADAKSAVAGPVPQWFDRPLCPKLGQNAGEELPLSGDHLGSLSAGAGLPLFSGLAV